jgi:hypothetical protein
VVDLGCNLEEEATRRRERGTWWKEEELAVFPNPCP